MGQDYLVVLPHQYKTLNLYPHKFSFSIEPTLKMNITMKRTKGD